jgi:hypothetical protein
VSKHFKRSFCGVCCCDKGLPSEKDVDCDPLVGSMIRFWRFSHFLIPLDTKEHVSHIRASPSKHRTNAVEQKQLCLDKSVMA